MTRLQARFARWALVLTVVTLLDGCGRLLPGQNRSGGGDGTQDPGDEFAIRTAPSVALGSVIRVNRHPLGTEMGQWHATATGVVVAPGVVVTLRSLTDGLTGDEDLRVIGQDNVAYVATINNQASDGELILISTPALPTGPIVMSDSSATEGDAATAAGYSMQVQTEGEGDAQVRRWTVSPNLLNGHITSAGDGVVHDMPTAYGYGGGALLDGCGRMDGILTESLEEQGGALQTAVSLERVQALLRAAHISPIVRTGWCAPQDLVNRVRGARRQVATADAAAMASYRGAQTALETQRNLGLFSLTALGAAAILIGGFGALLTAVRRPDPVRPQRKGGMTLLFAGGAVVGIGVALDPMSSLMHRPSRMMQLSCAFDAAHSSNGASVDRPVNLSFDPVDRCRGGAPQSGNLHYAVGVADPGSPAPVFIRTIRPAAASRQMGPGRPSIVETHVFSTDLSHYDIRRYQLPPVLYPSVQRVFMAHNTEQTCQTPQVSDDSQALRRQLIMPYAAERQNLVSHTAYTCTRVPPAGGH